jgi:antitoxin component of MazEF toxin-antitoxin module
MPLVRKIIKLGTSRVITLPEGWLKWLETKFGEIPKEVLIEVNEELKIRPLVNPPDDRVKGVAVSSPEA